MLNEELLKLDEEIMVCEFADIVDNDHGSATLQVALKTEGTGQSFMFDPCRAYEVLVLFRVERLKQCAGLPIVVCREENYGYIRKLKRLPCYEPYEVAHK